MIMTSHTSRGKRTTLVLAPVVRRVFWQEMQRAVCSCAGVFGCLRYQCPLDGSPHPCPQALQRWLRGEELILLYQKGTHSGQLIATCSSSSREIQCPLLASVGTHTCTHGHMFTHTRTRTCAYTHTRAYRHMCAHTCRHARSHMCT